MVLLQNTAFMKGYIPGAVVMKGERVSSPGLNEELKKNLVSGYKLVSIPHGHYFMFLCPKISLPQFYNYSLRAKTF